MQVILLVKMSIAQNISTIKNALPPHVKLVAVSKMQPLDAVRQAYETGQRSFAENRPQSFVERAAQLPPDIEWHFIGHLQTNKVKMVVGLAHLIHSGDSERLLLEIEKEAARRGIVQRCLLQLHVAQEESKSGFTPDELRELLSTIFLGKIPHVQIGGLMAMASLTDNTEQVRNEFRIVKKLFDELRQTYFHNNPAFCELSMGMSNDYSIAIEEGSTMVRIGTTLFAPQPPKEAQGFAKEN